MMPRAARPNLTVDTSLCTSIPRPNIQIHVNSISTTISRQNSCIDDPRSQRHQPSLCIETARSASLSSTRSHKKPRNSRFRRILRAMSPTSATTPFQPLLPNRPRSAFGADMEQFVLAICTRPEQQLWDTPDIYEDDQMCTTREQALYDISRRKLTRESAMPPPPPMFQQTNGLGNYTVITAGNSFSESTRTRKWS